MALPDRNDDNDGDDDVRDGDDDVRDDDDDRDDDNDVRDDDDDVRDDDGVLNTALVLTTTPGSDNDDRDVLC